MEAGYGGAPLDAVAGLCQELDARGRVYLVGLFFAAGAEGEGGPAHAQGREAGDVAGAGRPDLPDGGGDRQVLQGVRGAPLRTDELLESLVGRAGVEGLPYGPVRVLMAIELEELGGDDAGLPSEVFGDGVSPEKVHALAYFEGVADGAA